MFWENNRNVLGLCWVCVGYVFRHVLAMFCACLGMLFACSEHFLGICSGCHVYVFSSVLQSKSYLRIIWKAVAPSWQCTTCGEPCRPSLGPKLLYRSEAEPERHIYSLVVMG